MVSAAILIAIVALVAMAILTYKHGFTKALSITWAFLVAIGAAIAVYWNELTATVPPVGP